MHPDSLSSPNPSPQLPDITQPAILLELVREMRGQRESFDAAQKLAAAERKSERRWRMLFQALVFGFPVLLGVVYLLFFLNSTGFRWGPFGNVVGVVRIEGPIAANELASAEAIVPLLEKAFANPTSKPSYCRSTAPGARRSSPSASIPPSVRSGTSTRSRWLPSSTTSAPAPPS